MTTSEKAYIRCMGGSHCNHAPGTCTASPEYQAKVPKHWETVATETTKPVVTQADRIAAHEFFLGFRASGSVATEEFMAQHFARHRLASQAVVSQDLVPVASIGITIDPPSPVSLEQIARVLLATGECETCGTPCGTYIECNCERPIWAPASNITKARAILPIIEAAQISARNERDDFLVERGLWGDFTDWLAKRYPTPDSHSLRTPSGHQEGE